MSEQVLVTTQPVATAEPTVEQVAETAVDDSVIPVTTSKVQSAQEALPLITLGVQQNAALQQRQRNPSSLRHGFFRSLRIVNKIFSGLLRVFLIVLAGIGVAILVAYVVAVVHLHSLTLRTQVYGGFIFWQCSSQWCSNDVGNLLVQFLFTLC